jgi:hypothetical protein
MSYRDNLPVRASVDRETHLSKGSMFDLAEIAEEFAFDSGLGKLAIDEMFDLGEFAVKRMAQFTYVCGDSSRLLAESGFRNEGFKEFQQAVFQITGKMAMTMVGAAQQGMINRATRDRR